MARRRGKRWVAEAYDRTTRKKRYLGTRDTKREAQQLEAEWKLRTKATGRETCDQFARRWPADYPRPRESTNRHNMERVQRFAKNFAGVKLVDVDRPAARAWALEHRSCVSSVRAMFGDAVRDGLVDLNPFAGLRLPGSRGRKDLVALTERELVELADLVLDARMELGEYGPQYRAMVLFAGYVGLRPGELFALRRDDVVGQLATIERALSSKTGKIGETKNGRSRVVTVPPVAQDALLEVVPNPSGLLFVSPAGCMWTQSSHHRYWARLRLLANRPGLDFYALRHVAASLLLDRGATPWQVAMQLGHTDGGQLVMRLYGHPSEKLMRQQLLAVWEDDVQPLRSIDAKREAS